MRGVFVTGTDTGVGKTTLTSALARACRRRGAAVVVCKPIASGGEPFTEDTLILAEAAGLAPDEVTEWTFAEPLAPSVAARRAGMELTLESIAAAVRRRERPGMPMLVEGVGGLLCPLTGRETVADLAVCLALPLVVVVRRGLGTLNHTLLTLEAAKRRGLSVAGIVVNETSSQRGVAEETNVEELRRLVCDPLLGVLPFAADGRPEAPADLVDRLELA